MISNFNLTVSIDDASKLNSTLFIYTNNDGKWKLKNNSRDFKLEDAEFVEDVIQDIVFTKQYHLNLVDFDSHLENIKLDWHNSTLNRYIDELYQSAWSLYTLVYDRFNFVS